MTLTCDTAPVTEDDPTLDEIAAIAARIEAIRAEAKAVVHDLIAERNRRIVTYTARHPRSKTAAGRAAGLSRQRVDGIVRVADEVAAGREHEEGRNA